jgi:hypothetical protein
MTRNARLADLAVRLLFPAVLVVYLVGFLRSISGRSLTVAGYPRVMLAALAVLVVVVTVVELRDFRRGERPLVTRVGWDALPDNWWRAPFVAVCLVALFLLADVVGFFALSAVFVAGVMVVLGVRKPLVVVAVTTGFILASYYLFVVFFRLRLPEGWLP